MIRLDSNHREFVVIGTYDKFGFGVQQNLIFLSLDLTL
jgi:hypothetical protein